MTTIRTNTAATSPSSSPVPLAHSTQTSYTEITQQRQRHSLSLPRSPTLPTTTRSTQLEDTLSSKCLPLPSHSRPVSFSAESPSLSCLFSECFSAADSLSVPVGHQWGERTMTRTRPQAIVMQQPCATFDCRGSKGTIHASAYDHILDEDHRMFYFTPATHLVADDLGRYVHIQPILGDFYRLTIHVECDSTVSEQCAFDALWSKLPNDFERSCLTRANLQPMPLSTLEWVRTSQTDKLRQLGACFYAYPEYPTSSHYRTPLHMLVGGYAIAQRVAHIITHADFMLRATYDVRYVDSRDFHHIIDTQFAAVDQPIEIDNSHLLSSNAWSTFWKRVGVTAMEAAVSTGQSMNSKMYPATHRRNALTMRHTSSYNHVDYSALLQTPVTAFVAGVAAMLDAFTLELVQREDLRIETNTYAFRRIKRHVQRYLDGVMKRHLAWEYPVSTTMGALNDTVYNMQSINASQSQLEHHLNQAFELVPSQETCDQNGATLPGVRCLQSHESLLGWSLWGWPEMPTKSSHGSSCVTI